MDKFDEVNPYETTENDLDIEIDPAEAKYAEQQIYANQTPQQYAQPYQQNYQAQQYAQPNAQPYQQNYQAQQYAQPYNPNVQGINYGYQQYIYQNPQPKEPQVSAKGLGIAGMVCGIVSLPMSMYIISGFVAGILGLIFSIISKKKCSQQGFENKKANVGLILSIIGIALSFLVLVFSLAFVGEDSRGIIDLLEMIGY